MDERHRTGFQEVPCIHQTSDGQPPLDTGRARRRPRCISTLKPANEEQKFETDPDVYKKENCLNPPAPALGIVLLQPSFPLLPLHGTRIYPQGGGARDRSHIRAVIKGKQFRDEMFSI